MAALVIPDEKLLTLPHETYFWVDHPWPVLPSRADGAHMPELFCFSLWCEKIWTCACWLQWSRFGSRDVTTPTACVGWQKQSEMFVFISSRSFSLDCGKKMKSCFCLERMSCRNFMDNDSCSAVDRVSFDWEVVGSNPDRCWASFFFFPSWWIILNQVHLGAFLPTRPSAI